MANDMTVTIGSVPFGVETPHRYSAGSFSMAVSGTFSNCRMIKNNVISIPTNGTITYDTLMKLNYGTYSKGGGNSYYFFILNANYVNEQTVEIYIGIDWWTTVMENGGISYKDSYVHRIHPKSKTENLADIPDTVENISFSERTNINVHQIAVWGVNKEFQYVVGVTNMIPTERLFGNTEKQPRLDVYNLSPFPSLQNSGVTICCGITQGCGYYILNEISDVKNVLANAVDYGYTSSITGVWTVPAGIYSGDTSEVELVYYGGKSDENPNEAKLQKFTVTMLNSTNQVKAYGSPIDINVVPSSGYYSKCFTGQFRSVRVQSLGVIRDFNPQLLPISNGSARFYKYIDKSPDVHLYVTPGEYAGTYTGSAHNFFECVDIPLAMQGSLSADNTNNFYRQARINFSNGVLSQTANTLFNDIAQPSSYSPSGVSDVFSQSLEATALKGAGDIAVKTGKSLLNAVVSNGIDYITHTRQVDNGCSSVIGTGVSVLSLQLPSDTNGINISVYTINDNDLERLNKYFSMWGYNYSQKMTPYERDNYTFIQGDINFDGNMNNEARSYIKNLFSNGITIWKTAMYSYDA